MARLPRIALPSIPQHVRDRGQSKKPGIKIIQGFLLWTHPELNYRELRVKKTIGLKVDFDFLRGYFPEHSPFCVPPSRNNRLWH